MKHFIITIFLLISTLAALGQEGDMPLNHYNIPIPPQDYDFNDLKIDDQGRLLVAYKKGVLQFDGNSWLKIEISSSPIKFIELDGSTFLLAKDGVYQMKEDLFHQNKFKLLYSIPLISAVVDLISYEGKYLLLSNEEILILDKEFNKTNIYESNIGYKDVFVFENKLYAFEGNYLLENIDGTWVDLNLFAPENSDFMFSIQGANRIYFAYDNGDFYSFDGQDFDPYSSEVNEYLKENYPISGKFLDQKLVISTLTGGVVIIEEKSGKISSTIQNYNGLPSNQVSALTMDIQNGLWLAHPYGLSRASLDIPLSDFQFYPGLVGLPEVSLIKNDTLWVGTTVGLFYLKKVKDYETLQKKLVQKVQISTPRQPAIEREDDSNSFIEDLFSFGKDDSKEEEFIEEKLNEYRTKYRNEGIRFLALRQQLNEKEQELRDSLARNKKRISKVQKQKTERPRYRSVIKTIDISRLKSIDFEYQKIQDIDNHIQSLIETDFGLIAKCNTAIYLIKSDKAVEISNLKMVNSLYYQRSKQLLWASNEQGLFSIDLASNYYDLKKHSDHSFTDIIIKNDQLVAVSYNTLEVFDIKDNSLKTLTTLNITNNFSEEMALFVQENKIKLLRSDAILKFDSQSSTLEIDSIFDAPLKYFLKDQSDNLWLLSAHDEWNILNRELSIHTKNWLRIVPPVKNIYMGEDSLAFFTTNERIIRWESSLIKKYPIPNTFINGIMVENQYIETDEFVKLEHGQNNLKVILSTPEYLFKEEVEYQYYMKGLMDNWSAWSGNREIDFPYIPTGDYKLQIKARTILNDEISQFDFEFKVLPPYWQTWWFYGLEIAFFSILILISIRLNTSNKSSFLTKTFTFLTLILFLEFIATILENNLEGYVDESPVYSFIINVVLAVSISPIEKGITKLLIIFNSARSKQLISKMRKNQIKKNEQDKN